MTVSPSMPELLKLCASASPGKTCSFITLNQSRRISSKLLRRKLRREYRPRRRRFRRADFAANQSDTASRCRKVETEKIPLRYISTKYQTARKEKSEADR